MSFLRYDVDVSLSQPLQVISDPDGVLGQHVGNGVWTSAQELAIFIGSRLSLMRDQSVLELGAGLGLVGQAMLLACRPGLSCSCAGLNNASFSSAGDGCERCSGCRVRRSRIDAAFMHEHRSKQASLARFLR